jgi:hypothetical protein
LIRHGVSRPASAQNRAGGARNCRAAVPIAAAIAPCCKRAAHRLIETRDIAAKVLSAGSNDASESLNVTL